MIMRRAQGRVAMSARSSWLPRQPGIGDEGAAIDGHPLEDRRAHAQPVPLAADVHVGRPGLPEHGRGPGRGNGGRRNGSAGLHESLVRMRERNMPVRRADAREDAVGLGGRGGRSPRPATQKPACVVAGGRCRDGRRAGSGARGRRDGPGARRNGPEELSHRRSQIMPAVCRTRCLACRAYRRACRATGGRPPCSATARRGHKANGLPKEPVASFRLAPEHAQMCVMYFVTR